MYVCMYVRMHPTAAIPYYILCAAGGFVEPDCEEWYNATDVDDALLHAWNDLPCDELDTVAQLDAVLAALCPEECGICLEPICSPQDAMVVAGCGHAFCRMCFTEYVAAAVRWAPFFSGATATAQHAYLTNNRVGTASESHGRCLALAATWSPAMHSAMPVRC